MKWRKDNGTEIETNDSMETVAYCVSLGWKEVGIAKETPAPDKVKVAPVKPTEEPVVEPKSEPVVKSGKIKKKES